MRRSSVTSPIPKDIRDMLACDPFMSLCCLEDETCNGRIQWHHNFIYAEKRQNEWWCILPVCEFHHAQANKTTTKEKLDCIMIGRAPSTVLQKYPKYNWVQRIKYLSHKYHQLCLNF